MPARLIGPHFAERLGAESVFENRSGASGLVGYKATKAAVAEGDVVINVLSGAQTLIGAAHGRLPDPVTGMHLLGQIAGSRYVWATGKDSPFATLDDVFATARERPIVFAVFEPKGSAFTRIVGMNETLGLDATYVTGYKRSPQIAMAAIRQEVDVIAIGLSGQESLFENGDLRPLMTLNGGIGAFGMDALPTFAGPDGVVMARARALGRDLDDAAAEAAAITAFSEIGRIVAVPMGVDPTLIPCLRATLEATFASPEFRRDAEATGRPMDTLSAEATEALIERARARLETLKRVADAAAARLSQ
ncbi:MAG TPA: tripartite tricarboxylate transporter substrate-binding protein [Myxococcota bacterium]|nr:tripartite tricarboxylate transporter substrate-binding protein [Myxococcota bacterium]